MIASVGWMIASVVFDNGSTIFGHSPSGIDDVASRYIDLSGREQMISPRYGLPANDDVNGMSSSGYPNVTRARKIASGTRTESNGRIRYTGVFTRQTLPISRIRLPFEWCTSSLVSSLYRDAPRKLASSGLALFWMVAYYDVVYGRVTIRTSSNWGARRERAALAPPRDQTGKLVTV